jgi:hypothetical protein
VLDYDSVDELGVTIHFVNDDKHDFAFTVLFRCGHCGFGLVGELKKQKYVYCPPA